MSIETEFESTITNVKNAYQGLDNLGATIPQNRTIENIKSCLDEIYAKFPKTSYVEGTEITLSNTLKGKLDFEDNKVGYGDTQQDSATGSNLMNTEKLVNGTYNGLTIIKDSDDFINISGTATANTSIILSEITYNFPSELYISYENNFTTSTAQLTFSNGSTTLGGLTFSGANRTYNMSTMLGGKTCTKIELYITSGNTINGKFRPMLNTQSGQTYSKYAFPNPSYPQEIEVVRGKNRFNNIIEQGTLNADGADVASTTRVRTNGYVQLDKNTYTISMLGADEIGAYLFDSQKRLLNATGWLTLPATITLNQNGYIRFAIRKSDNSNLEPSEITNIQLEKGSQATSYLPYNTIEVVERGKNWFTTANVGTWTKRSNALNIEYNGANTIKLSTGSSTYGYGYSAIAEYPAKIGKKYVVSYKVSNKTNSTTADSNHILLNASEHALSGSPVGSNTVIATSDKIWLFILLAKVSTETSQYATVDLSDIQIEEISESETEPTTYEPYQTPKTYQLSLGEYEFAKTDIPDKIIYDIANDKVYLDKNTRKVVFNGTETWTMTQTAVGYRFRIDLGGIKASTSAAAIPKLYCDKLIANSLDNIWNGGGNCIGIFSNLSGVVVICLADLTINTVEKFKTWLESNNLTAYLPLVETSREEITGTLKDQIKALYNSHSFTGTTIITSDGELPLVLKVRALKGE